jgi:beta-glucosidase
MEGKKTIVVLTTPGATLTEFTKDADAVLVNFYAGEKFPEAIANILTGHANPSGKLPVSFPKFENDIYMNK